MQLELIQFLYDFIGLVLKILPFLVVVLLEVAFEWRHAIFDTLFQGTFLEWGPARIGHFFPNNLPNRHFHVLHLKLSFYLIEKLDVNDI